MIILRVYDSKMAINAKEIHRKNIILYRNK